MRGRIISAILVGGLACCLSFSSVNAKEKNFFYQTAQGVKLTEVQYNNLSKVFDEDTIYTMSAELIDSLKDNENLKMQSTEKYIRMDEYYDSDGNVISVKNKEIDERTAKRIAENKGMLQSHDKTYSTSSKKVRMTVVTPGASTKVVTITNTWLAMPRTHSYDILAVRPENTAFTTNFDDSSFSAYQKYDGHTVRYDSSSNHINSRSGFGRGTGGVGISVNIPNDVGNNLSSSMTVRFRCGANPFKIYGTYQHATSSVSLSDSKSYTFSQSGLGNVVDFSSRSLRNKYDGMEGIFLSYRDFEEYD